MMSISAKKLTALCRKDFIDFFKNPTILVSVLVPIFFVLIYKYIDLPQVTSQTRPTFLLNFGTLINCAMAGLMIGSTSISEEKEKFTLRTLMLSNVSGPEFLAAKLIVSFSLTMAGNVLIFLLTGVSAHNLPFYLISTALGSLALNLISAVIGILSRDQMSCGILQLPVMLLFVMPPVFGNMHPAFHALAIATPLNAMMNLYYYGTDGRLFTRACVPHMLVLAGWIAASVLLFLLIYRKKGLDR